MVYFAGVGVGARQAGEVVGKRGLAVYEGDGRTCRSACKLVYFEFCECNGGLNSKELDKFRYKVTKREKQWFFDKADTNKNGVLERNEVRALLDSIKLIPDPAFAVQNNHAQMAVPKVDDAELDLLIRLANKQSGSSVGPEHVGHLIILHRVLSRNRHVINAAFDRFDLNGDGFLSEQELAAFMMDIDPRATGHERAALLDRFFAVDKDNDGLITRAEILVSIGYWKEMLAAARSQASFNKWCCCLLPATATSSVSPEERPFAAGVAGQPIWVIPASEVVVVAVVPSGAAEPVPAVAVPPAAAMERH